MTRRHLKVVRTCKPDALGRPQHIMVKRDGETEFRCADCGTPSDPNQRFDKPKRRTG